MKVKKFLLLPVLLFSTLAALSGCGKSVPVETGAAAAQTTAEPVEETSVPDLATAVSESESRSEETQISEQEPDDEEERDQAALETRINQLFEQALRLKDIHKRKSTATFCEPTPDGEYLIYEFGEIDTYEKYEELLKDTYTEELVNDYFQKAENGRIVNLDHQLAVPCDNPFTILTEDSWEDVVPELWHVEENECIFKCAPWELIETDYGTKKAYDEKYVTVVLCEDGKWRLDSTSIDFDRTVPAGEVNLFYEGSPMEAEIRRLCDQNILQMNMFGRKYGPTYFDSGISSDKSYNVYEFGDIDTYSKYKELLYDTYTSHLVDFYLFHPYGFDDLDDRLIVYADKAILIIDNVNWEDYQLEILWQSEKECYFQCIAFEYIGGEYEADGTNKRVYEKHRAVAVLCDDGQWRLDSSFF